MLKIEYTSSKTINPKFETLILPVSKSFKANNPILKKCPQNLTDIIKKLIEKKSFTGTEIITIHSTAQNKLQSIILVGLGDQKDITYNTFRKKAGDIIRILNKQKKESACWILEDSTIKKLELPLLCQSITEGSILGNYELLNFKSKPKSSSTIKNIEIIHESKSTTDIKNAITKGFSLGSAVNEARDLANTPANVLTPAEFINRSKKAFSKFPHINCEVIDKKKAKSLKMNAFLGVAQGSNNDPFVLILRYQPKQKEKPLCIIGKGVTFDSGGISIKPAFKMGAMKGDMGGAAATFGCMLSVAELKPKQNITAIIPLVENMPSGTAQRPGDIVTAMNGKTIEIINTDAEGRLIMADALCYAVEKEKAKEIIDIATLTGAASIALGKAAGPIIGNTQSIIETFIQIGEFTGDRLWQLPNYEEFLDELKSDLADICHANDNRQAGTCTAAKFLEQFVDKTPWTHLDIANVMQHSSANGYHAKGMAGVGVRNLVEYILRK